MTASRAPTPMSLRDLLDGFADPGPAGGIIVRGLALDSRRVRSGDAFVALDGAHVRGITFAPQASARGAAVILADRAGTPATAPGADSTGGPPLVHVDGLRAKLGAIAARFHGEPSQSLTVIAVTGTNGKTSTVQFLAQALTRLGRGAATIGTLGAGPYGAPAPTGCTTPDALEVQALLADFRAAGIAFVVMEVSSHALDQRRVDAVRFDTAVFTNLTRDHLDYHGTMAAYGEAKERLFSWPGLACAVVNVDDPFGKELASRLPRGVDRLRCGTRGGDIEIGAHGIVADTAGLAFDLATPWGHGRVATRLVGRFNVANALAVAACLGRQGFGFDAIAAAIAALSPVTGRMTRLGGAGNEPLVVIDYAHTPDALEQALTSLADHRTGRLVCVFGCGGERDAGKRPEMGAIAARLADEVIVTDDNPRGENGDTIVAGILAGIPRGARVTVERDRARAIARALATAGPGDVVLVAGKGHEAYQEVAGERHPFDDVAVARDALEVRRC